MAAAGTGQNVGIAQGEIRISTRDVARARAVVLSESRVMGRAMEDNIGGGARRASRTATGALDTVNKSLNNLIESAGLAATAITLGGINSANKIARLNSLIETLAGSEAKAADEMARLEQLAERTNQPFVRVLESASALYPALRTTNADLSKTILLAQRLAVLDPAQGVQGAAFAIREFLSGEYISLSRRFEMSRSRLQQIRDLAAGDQQRAIELLSQYVDELGLTEEAMIRMNREGYNAFSVLRGEAQLLLAEGFRPATNAINDIAFAFADLAKIARNTDDDLVKILGTLTAIVGIANAPRALTLIPGVSNVRGAGTIARLGVGAAALYGGAQLGAGIARAGGIGEARGKSQDEVMSTVGMRIKQLMVILFDAFGDIAVRVRMAGMQFSNASDTVQAEIELAGALLRNAFATVVDALGSAAGAILDIISQLTQERKVDLGLLGSFTIGSDRQTRAFSEAADRARAGADPLYVDNETMSNLVDRIKRGTSLSPQQERDLERMREGWNNVVVAAGEALGVIKDVPSTIDNIGSAFGRLEDIGMRAIGALGNKLQSNDLRITDDLLGAFEDYQSDLAAIDQEAAQARAEEERDYQQRRVEMISTFNDRVAQMQEDELVRYRRALEDLQRQERAVMDGLAETIAAADENLYERTQELRENYHDAEAKAQQEHYRRLQQIQRNAREQLLDAAAHLNAEQVYQIQRNSNRQLREEQDRYAEGRDERADALQEALEQELESHDERLEAAREAAAERLEDMREQFKREEERRREDNDRRLQQMRQAHQAELRDLYYAHQTRLQEIRNQHIRERNERDAAFRAEFAQTQTHLTNIKTLHQNKQTEIEAELRAWYDRNKQYWIPPSPTTTNTFSGTAKVEGVTSPTGVGTLGPPRFASGGTIQRTGIIYGHAGEEVIPARESSALRRLMGGNVSPMALVRAVAGGGRGGMSLTIQQGAIPITVNEAQDGMQAYEQIESRLYGALVRVVQGAG